MLLSLICTRNNFLLIISLVLYMANIVCFRPEGSFKLSFYLLSEVLYLLGEVDFLWDLTNTSLVA